jgi:hypothetical protein
MNWIFHPILILGVYCPAIGFGLVYLIQIAVES